MTASRARRRVRAVRLAALVAAPLLTVGSFDAWAQAPIPAQGTEAPTALQPPAALAPPRALKPLGPAEPEKPATVTAPSTEIGPKPGMGLGTEPGVEVDTLAKVDPETAGTLGPDDGGLGFNLWQGASREYVAGMIAALPVQTPSPALRSLMHRLLLTAAEPPKKAPPADGENQSKPKSLIALRVQQLAAIGDVAGVGDLLAAIPGTVSDPALLQVEADARFLTNDNARACGLTAQQIQAGGGAYWQKAMIFCQILAGEPEKADLGIAMLNELGAKEPAFFALTDRLLGGTSAELAGLKDADGLLLAMARAAKMALPPDAAQSTRPGVLRAVAVNPNVAPDIRLEAAERAENVGALETEALRQLYSSVTFEQEDLNRPLSRADELGGPLARALLYHSALAQKVPTAQAEIIAKALQIAISEGRYGAAARVFQPLVAKIPPSADLLWFAPEVVRLMSSTNAPEGAEAWFKLLQSNVQFQDENRDLLLRMTPLVRLVGTMGQDKEPRDLTAWWRSVAGEEGAARRAALLYALLDGLGEEIPLAAWQAMGPVTGQVAAEVPHPALWFRLQAVTQKVNEWTAHREAMEAIAEEAILPPGEPVAGQVAAAPVAAAQLGTMAAPGAPEETPLPPHRGEVVLMVLSLLGDGGVARIEAPVLHQAVESLRAIGLDQEARDLALEAALAAGL